MSSRVGVNLRASAYLHQGDRKYMEDEFQVAYQRTHDKKDIEYAFFGIFDGHGGKEAAHFAKDNLMDNIVSQKLFWSDSDDDVLCAIKEGFLDTHMAMWKVVDQWPRTASGWPSTSGTTASIAFIRRQKIYIGHVGDSGIVLGYEDDSGMNEWVGESLTRDHKPESSAEMNRINKCGGKVVAKSGVPRVVWNRPKSGHQGPVRRSTPMDEIPFLAVARSLGDLWSYNAINDMFVVSPEPDVCVLDIDINIHRCLIFGTDGLWNALSPTSAVNTAYFTEKNNEKHYLGIPMVTGRPRLWVNPSRSIVSGALNRYASASIRADNTSAVTVFLDPPGRPKREVLLNQYSMKKGSPLKNTSPKAANKKANREASVQVHVYNQNQNGKDENRGLFRIKERIPEPVDPLSHVKDDNAPLEDRRRSIPDVSSIDAVDLSCSSSTTCLGKCSSSSNSCDQSSPCSECGCTSHSPPRVTPLDMSYREENNQENMTIDKCSTSLSKSCTRGDDIQIPVISSSTPTTTTVASSQNANNNDCAGSRNKSSSKASKRRTRSCATLPKSSKTADDENKNDSKLTKSHSMREGFRSNRSSHNNNHDASNRILKSINGGDKIDPTSKRKRPREILNNMEEIRTPKSLRIHTTRSHTSNHKAMVTRSQDKSQKVKAK